MPKSAKDKLIKAVVIVILLFFLLSILAPLLPQLGF